jgi:hypothetical protein
VSDSPSCRKWEAVMGVRELVDVCGKSHSEKKGGWANSKDEAGRGGVGRDKALAQQSGLRLSAIRRAVFAKGRLQPGLSGEQDERGPTKDVHVLLLRLRLSLPQLHVLHRHRQMHRRSRTRIPSETRQRLGHSQRRTGSRTCMLPLQPPRRLQSP